MNVKFSMKRLLINVTLFALLMGLITSFPTVAVRIAMALSIYFPATAVSVACAACSLHPSRVMASSLAGAVIGWVLSPKVYVNWARPPTSLDLYLLDLSTQIGPTMIGAALAGGIALAVSRSAPLTDR